jgi:hypothetical protein
MRGRKERNERSETREDEAEAEGGLGVKGASDAAVFADGKKMKRIDVRLLRLNPDSMNDFFLQRRNEPETYDSAFIAPFRPDIICLGRLSRTILLTCPENLTISLFSITYNVLSNALAEYPCSVTNSLTKLAQLVLHPIGSRLLTSRSIFSTSSLSSLRERPSIEEPAETASMVEYLKRRMASST